MSTSSNPPADQWKHALVSVTMEGRGFIMDTGDLVAGRVILTAAHCLPDLPRTHPLTTEELTYSNILGTLGTNPTIWAECLFVDPVADLAVLGRPDNQGLPDQSDAFDQLVATGKTLRLASIPDWTDIECWLLSLDGQWRHGIALAESHRRISISRVEDGIDSGMSGSPILIGDGAAISVVSCSNSGSDDVQSTGSGPRLSHALPSWLVRALMEQQSVL